MKQLFTRLRIFESSYLIYKRCLEAVSKWYNLFCVLANLLLFLIA